MDLQQLRYVVAVSDLRNFTRAAASCFVAQSALSQQVKSLERELGVELFRRNSRRVELTVAGEAFLPEARACLAAAERAEAAAAGAIGVVRGPLRIGAVSTFTAFGIADLLALFRSQHPRVQVSLRVAGSDALDADLHSGRLDVAFLGLSSSTEPKARHRELLRHRLVAVLPETHPLAGRTELSLRELSDFDFVDFPAGTPGRVQSEVAFNAAGLTRRVLYESDDLYLLGELVAQGLAVALLPPRVVTDWRGLVARPVTDGPERVEYAAWNGFNPSPATTALLSLIGRPIPTASRLTAADLEVP